jgi:hypothetical protein
MYSRRSCVGAGLRHTRRARPAHPMRKACPDAGENSRPASAETCPSTAGSPTELAVDVVAPGLLDSRVLACLPVETRPTNHDLGVERRVVVPNRGISVAKAVHAFVVADVVNI